MTAAADPADREDLDVAALPTTVFGARDLMWWATLGFMTIEGMTLLVCVATYFYLWRQPGGWPPEHTFLPSTPWPTIHVAFLLATNLVMRRVSRAAHQLDMTKLRRWMIVASVCSLITLPLRWQDFLALNVRWDANAYGSIAWMTVAFHATLLIVNTAETCVFTALMHRRPTERHFTDACDLAVYWLYMTLVWVPLYAMLYWAPRFL
jgi:heme/copper-type cytochrome/quinol oxidase subunit 3